MPESSKWKDLWNKYFLGNNSEIKLIESVYKPWTIDESCGMPFAEEKGFVMGDWAHHMLHLYELLDFELPESFSYCPDHLQLELEFMSLLVEEMDYKKQYQFIVQHLNWLTDLVNEAEEKEAPQFCLDLLIWLAQFVASDKSFLADNLDDEVLAGITGTIEKSKS